MMKLRKAKDWLDVLGKVQFLMILDSAPKHKIEKVLILGMPNRQSQKKC